MIRDITHNTKETKQGTMALVQCHIELMTTAQKPGEPIEDYFQLTSAEER